MKKRSVLLLLLSVFLVGCNNVPDCTDDTTNVESTDSSGDINANKWRLDLLLNYEGAGIFQTQYVNNNGYGTRPSVPPERSGYEFLGWFEDEKTLVPFVFLATKITCDWNIYAGWEKQGGTTQYAITWTSGAGYNYQAVSGTLPNTAESGTTINFKVNVLSGYEGTPVVKANETILTPAGEVYSFILNAATTITVTNLIAPTMYQITWTSGVGYSYQAVSGSLPTNAASGTTVNFKVNVAYGYEGTPVVKANTTTLTPSNEVYSFVLNVATTITVTGLTAVVTDNYRVYYSNLNGWDSVSVYMWNSVNTGNQNGLWPGVPMQRDPAAHNYFYFELDLSTNTFDRIIFNDGIAEGGQQTSDLVLNTSFATGTIYLGFGSTPTAAAFTGQEDTMPDINYSQWGLCGTGNGLNWSTPNYMIENEDGSASITMDLSVNTQFKVTNKTIWYGYTNLANGGAKANFADVDGNNHNIGCTVAGRYLITFKDEVITITLV